MAEFKSSLTAQQMETALISASNSSKQTLVIGSEDFPTLQSAMDFTEGYIDASFIIEFPAPDGETHTATLKRKSVHVYENSYRFITSGSVKTIPIISFGGASNSGNPPQIKGGWEFVRIEVYNNSAPMYIIHEEGICQFAHCRLGNYIHWPQRGSTTVIGDTDTVIGAENAIWAYSNAYVELLAGSVLLRTEISAKNRATIYCHDAVMGGENSSSVYSGTAVELFEEAKLILQHTTSLKVQNMTKGIVVHEGACVKNASEIIWDNVATHYNIPVNEIQYNGSCIYEGGSPITLKT